MAQTHNFKLKKFPAGGRRKVGEAARHVSRGRSVFHLCCPEVGVDVVDVRRAIQRVVSILRVDVL